MSSFPFPVIKFLLLPLTIMTSLTATDWLIDRTSTQLTVCSDWQQQQQQQQTKTLHSFFSPHSGDFDPGTYSHRLTDGTFLRCCSCCWQNGILLLLCFLWMWLGLLQHRGLRHHHHHKHCHHRHYRRQTDNVPLSAAAAAVLITIIELTGRVHVCVCDWSQFGDSLWGNTGFSATGSFRFYSLFCAVFFSSL